ncbi:MAG: DUF1570 domain-containing protein [Pirellulales bacterium]|nr:DUF1570 domain-containing protein [Pirellulales bacterium]
MTTVCRHRLFSFAMLAALLTALPAGAVEHVEVHRDGRTQWLSGKVVAEDSVGSMLLETDEGALWPLQASTIRSRTSDDKPFEPLDKDQLAGRLLAELGPEFQAHNSKHYVVVFNTTRTYAKWCSSLLERLQKAFIAFWKKKGCDVKEPDKPLAVLVFGDKASYLRHAKTELGGAASNAIGYYSLQTNRIVMYDLTGMQALRRENNRRGTLHDITALLSQPEAEPLVATIVHEATHQIAFNCGLQRRYVDNPVWLGEGLAMFFETPDLASNRSWRGTGKVNYHRWNLFRDNYAAGKVGSLKSLIVDDSRIRNPRTTLNVYAESWAWTYFLIKWRPKQFAAYLKMLADKPLLKPDDRETRLRDFQSHFGENLAELEDEFYRRMSRIK